MAHDDPFTFDMFGTTLLSSGIGLGVTAFAGDFETGPQDDDPDPTPTAPAAALRPAARTRIEGQRANFFFEGGEARDLARSWKERAKINVAVILSANELEKHGIPATREQQKRLVRFTGFGAGELANGMFRRPGEAEFREGWDDLGASLETAVSDRDYSSLSRCTQYAHFTPELLFGRSGLAFNVLAGAVEGAGTRHRHGAFPSPDAGGLPR